MTRIVSLHEALAAIAKIGGRIAMPGATGEATPFIEAWRADPELAAGLTFRGLFVPGFNAVDYAALHETARMETIFAAPEARASLRSGKAALFPLPYTRAYAWLRDVACDVGIVHVAPGQGDVFSAGVCADTAPAIIHAARFKIALVNSAAPRIDDPARTPHFSRGAFDLIVEADAPLLTAPRENGAAESEAVAAQAAALIRDGDAVQFGIGKLPAAILARLKDRRSLRIHSGMYVDAVLDLMDAGALDRDAPMLAGVAIGGAALHDRLAREKRARFGPVPMTHGFDAVSTVPNFAALNGALQIDLFGQVNSEWIGARRTSGLGGLPDFVRGAAAAPGGRAIIALPAAHKGESRILPKLSAPCVTLAAHDAQVFVTEHGAADVRGLSARARAEAIIAIAAPDHRAALSDAWRILEQEM